MTNLTTKEINKLIKKVTMTPKKREKLIKKIKDLGLEADFKRWHGGITLDNTAGWIIQTYDKLIIRNDYN